MKILHTVESYYPDVNGMSEVVRRLSEGLVALGHDVTVVTGKNIQRKGKKNINGVKIVEFNVSGKSALIIYGNAKKYQNYLTNSTFDIITNFAGQQWATDLMLPILKNIKAKKVFVPTGFSGLYSLIYRNYYKKMKQWMKEYDLNIFLSKNYRDINFARKNKVGKIKVLPNGASKKEFSIYSRVDIRQKLSIPSDHFLILNVSSHTRLKGHADAIKIFEKANLPKTTFLIIGKHPKTFRSCYNQCRLKASLGKKNILIEDLTRKETVAAFKSANLFLFTSKVECSPLVLFECLAGKTPFLSTDVGNAKEIVGWTKGGILLPTKINKLGYSSVQIDGSIKVLKDCYDNRKKLCSTAKAGHKNWQKKFTWEKITKQYEKVYFSLLKS
jgi:glycosyltransferase involved in cell wall biosynthesis